MIYNLLKLGLALIAIIFLINISLRALNDRLGNRETIMKTIEKLPLDNNTSLQIARVCGKYYFLGVSNGQVNLLKELDKDEVEEILAKKEMERENIKNSKISELVKRGSRID